MERVRKAKGIICLDTAGMILGDRRAAFTKKDARELVQMFNDHVCLKEEDVCRLPCGSEGWRGLILDLSETF